MCLPLAICTPNHPRKIQVQKRSYKKTYLTVSLNTCVQFTKKDDIPSPSDLYNVAWL